VREVVLDVLFDGPDLAEVAELTGLDVGTLVDALTTTRLTAAFGGFAPGFAYLTGLPDDLQVPRRATPRTRVPAGAVGLAGPYAGVYPRASPGGWQLVGRTDAVLFDVDRDPPALLSPGTSVRFRAC
jgi:KipI family sensor histidine kinase inhibitor